MIMYAKLNLFKHVTVEVRELASLSGKLAPEDAESIHDNVEMISDS